MRGSRDGAVVRGLPPKFLCPSLIPGPGVTSESSLLSVLVLAPRVFPRIFQLFSLHKNQHSTFQFNLETADGKSHQIFLYRSKFYVDFTGYSQLQSTKRLT